MDVWKARVQCPGCARWGGLGKWKTLISVELVAEMEEEAGGLAGQTTGGCQGEVGGDQEIVDVVGVNFSGDSDVVAGRASVAENSALVGSGPHETEDSRID